MLPVRKMHPMMKIMSKSLIDLPAPINISLWWNYGSLLGLFLIVQILSGIFLSMHYSPNMEMSFNSMIHIMRDVNWGWMLHNIHMNGASFFMMFMYIHMMRGMYYKSFHLYETWNIGVTIFIMSMMTAFMGYVLPWGQMSFWGATVITNIFSAIPYIGTELVQWLWGGFAVSAPTLSRFFSMHFIMPFIILLLMMVHLMMLHEKGSNNPLGMSSNADRIPFHLYFTMKDTLGFLMFLPMFMIIVLLFPNILMDPENFSEANPMMTPKHIQPEWYFLWLYAILRSVPNKLGGVIALLSAILILYVPPMFYSNKMSMSYYPLSQLWFFTLLSSWLILSWIGMCQVEAPFIILGQMFTMLYFSYFLISPNMTNFWDNNIMK